MSTEQVQHIYRDAVTHQHSVVDAIIQSYTPTFRAATDAEIERLCKVIDSLKLERALKRRVEVESQIDEGEARLNALRDEWCKLKRGIDTMIAEGVAVQS